MRARLDSRALKVIGRAVGPALVILGIAQSLLLDEMLEATGAHRDAIAYGNGAILLVAGLLVLARLRGRSKVRPRIRAPLPRIDRAWIVLVACLVSTSLHDITPPPLRAVLSLHATFLLVALTGAVVSWHCWRPPES